MAMSAPAFTASSITPQTVSATLDDRMTTERLKFLLAAAADHRLTAEDEAELARLLENAAHLAMAERELAPLKHRFGTALNFHHARRATAPEIPATRLEARLAGVANLPAASPAASRTLRSTSSGGLRWRPSRWPPVGLSCSGCKDPARPQPAPMNLASSPRALPCVATPPQAHRTSVRIGGSSRKTISPLFGLGRRRICRKTCPSPCGSTKKPENSAPSIAAPTAPSHRRKSPSRRRLRSRSR